MLDWQTGEETWEAVQEKQEEPAQEPRFPTPRTTPRWLLIALVIVLVALGGAAGFLRWKSNQRTARLREDIQSTVDTEAWAVETRNLKLYRSLLDPAADSRWRDIQVRAFEDAENQPAKQTVTDALLFGSDVAVAELKVEPPAGNAYLKTRAYRRSGGMWLETSIPSGQVWLDQMSRETENLRFVFHQRDGKLVAEVMPAIQALYSQVLEDLRLSPPQGKRTLYVIRSVRPIDSELGDDPTYYDLSGLSSDVDSELIKRRLGALLLGRVMAVFSSDEGDLAYLVQAVEQWEYATWLNTLPVPGNRVAQREDLLVSLPFLSLTDEAWKSLEHPPALAAASQGLVSYVVRTYGRLALADVVRGAQQYDGWYPFITNALQVSEVLQMPFVEFDAGWRDYALRTFTELGGTRPGLLTAEKVAVLQLLSQEQRMVTQGDREGYLVLLAGDDEWQSQQMRRFDTYQQFLQRTNGRFRLDLKDLILYSNEPAEPAEEALLRVVVHFPDPGSPPYQEIRRYRPVDGAWQWVATPVSFWGLGSEESTDHLSFSFNRQDAAVVRAQMPATEAYFLRISHDLDLAERVDEWLTPLIDVQVVPEYHVLDWQGEGGGVQVLSPSLGAVATGLSPADFYRLSVGMALAGRVIEAQVGDTQSPFAEAVLEAVARWETEQWASDVPWAAPRRQRIGEMLAAGPPVLLRGRPTGTELSVNPDFDYLYDTVIAYVAETYDRTTLGRLVQRTPRYQSWETLVPAVLDVDFEEFEAGWLEYLGLKVGRLEG